MVNEDDNCKFRFEKFKTLKYLRKNHVDGKFFFNLKSSYMFSLALSVSFEYLCYGSATIINILTRLTQVCKKY